MGELRVGLIHGRMKPAEKAEIMAEFKAGNLQLLVATTVIEVGVDVPNASLMIIETPSASAWPSCTSCVAGWPRQRRQPLRAAVPPAAVADRPRAPGHHARNQRRLHHRRKDLALRGPGEMLGTRQTGLLQFKVADLMRDADLLPAVRDAAQALIARWPEHVSPLLDRWLRHGQQYGQV